MTITDMSRSARTEGKAAFVVAATPTGPMAHAIDAYRQAVAVRVGANTAHQSPPHCLLALSFEEDPSATDVYRRALARATRDDRGVIAVTATALTTTPEWHGLELESGDLIAVGTRFAQEVAASAGTHHVTVHHRLRLTLACDFEARDRDALCEFAHRIVDPALPAEWRVGLWVDTGDWASVPQFCVG
ncbi:MAG TPA: hypothetical protein VM282_25360 [Acidimicrobiales bacterium]|nr:hypothetical protein [Acidimicrobiales bacterium]